jgi:threonine dehydrogenase-like Zn-dependent dehydrogenase
MRHEDELLGNTLDDSSLSLRLIAGAEIAAARIWIDNWHRMLPSIECMTVDPLETETAENSFDFVIDAVGAKATRTLAIGAVKPGGVVMHIGLQVGRVRSICVS